VYVLMFVFVYVFVFVFVYVFVMDCTERDTHRDSDFRQEP
jgi:hypothetical protein